MRAVVSGAGGEPDFFRMVALPVSRSDDTEVLIRVEANSIEGGDLTDRQTGKTRYPDSAREQRDV